MRSATLIYGRSSLLEFFKMKIICLIDEKQSLKLIDWEQFIMNILAHNLVVQMRMLKKAKEKRSKLTEDNSLIKNAIMKIINEKSEGHKTSEASNPHEKKLIINDLLTNPLFLSAAKASANLSESNLIDLFFDLEAEHERGICRDDVTYNSADKEIQFLQELSEIVCYSLLPANAFDCLPLRCLVREILANHLIKYVADNLTDPDYINQTILYVCQDQAALKTENFLIAISHTDSLDELKELRNKIDEEILKTRSFDKGGQNDQDIKLRLSSLQYLKRKIDSCILNIFKISNKSGAAAPKLVEEDENKLLLFNQHLANLDFLIVCKNETIQHCFIEYMGKQNVQNLISFYLNADMYREFAVKELNSAKILNSLDVLEVKMSLKDFANGLINSYLLSASNFVATSQNEDDQPINISNRVYYKAELARTIEKLESLEQLNEFLLDDLQTQIFLLMKQKYYPEFKNYTEFHKLLLKNDFLLKLNAASSPTTSARLDEMQSSGNSFNFSPSFDLSDDDFIISQTSSIGECLIDEGCLN